ncbi:TPA: helix-turn-helix transcriptional regulator [Clostridioides difficile]|nr:XRE family transcriptional regulator [Clostridioides difficile]MDB2774885.1 XRE family transcriptional regulator [Clostridioides difficile]MDB3274939.1 XRE family transcriptional regulator [Clostridioides difficile]MDB3275080.1 XRE family transcriptional regulator [Clostridioides difficile]MDB3647338.1 XRE family transcriptional regulator [Clostridioides difficile]
MELYNLIIGGDDLNTMICNLKKLRKELGLSQKEFGDKLKLTSASISKLENGERNITERHISQICEVFNVNEDWLRNGNGEMFKNIDDIELAAMMGKTFSSNDEFLKKVFLTFAELTDDEREVIQKVIDKLSK